MCSFAVSAAHVCVAVVAVDVLLRMGVVVVVHQIPACCVWLCLLWACCTRLHAGPVLV
jgi:hypothetical protein